jgi:serine/threonine protein kinase
MVSSNAVHPVAPTPLVAGVNRGEAYHHPFNRKDSQAAQIGEQLEHDELESIENPSAKSPTACRTLTVGGENFSLPMKYLAYRVIGRGSYGVVISGKDCDTNTDVAIKKNKNVFSRVVKRRMSESEKQELHISKITKPRSLLSQIRLLREIKITQHLNHPNIISLLDIIRPTSIDVLVDVFTVNELMESDLRDVLNSRQVCFIA